MAKEANAERRKTRLRALDAVLTRIAEAERTLTVSRSLRDAYMHLRTRIWIDRLARVSNRDRDDVFACALDGAISIESADCGVLQLLDAERQVLKIRMQRGFEQPFLDFFAEVTTEMNCACGRALRDRLPVVVHDVSASAIFIGTPELRVIMAAGIEGVKSVPLFSGERFIGVLSVHYLPLFGRMTNDVTHLEQLARVISTRLVELGQ